MVYDGVGFILDEVLVQYGSVIRNREARLMEVCDWQGMSDEKWTSILKVPLYNTWCKLCIAY